MVRGLRWGLRDPTGWGSACLRLSRARERMPEGQVRALLAVEARSAPHPALRATFSRRREKGKQTSLGTDALLALRHGYARPTTRTDEAQPSLLPLAGEGARRADEGASTLLRFYASTLLSLKASKPQSLKALKPQSLKALKP